MAYAYQGYYNAYGAGFPGAAAGAFGQAADEIRTIFITGFPVDVKERELNNLMRFLPGYEASQMNYKNGMAQGFALFANGAMARAACDQIQGLPCEMARKNMYIKSDGAPGGMGMGTGTGMGMVMGMGGNMGGNMSGMGGMGGMTAPPEAKRQRVGGYSGGSGGFQRQGGYNAGGGGGGDNPPCNTLFVGNLAENVNEAELSGMFMGCPGFKQLKLNRGMAGRATTAFVEFDTVENANRVHAEKQNATLSSNGDRGGIRIQYSRNPFGKKRDVTGQLIDTPVKDPDVVAHGAPAGVVGVAGPEGAQHDGQY